MSDPVTADPAALPEAAPKPLKGKKARAGLVELKEQVPADGPQAETTKHWRVWLERKDDSAARDCPELLVKAEDKDGARDTYRRYCGIRDTEHRIQAVKADAAAIERLAKQKHLGQTHPVLA